MKGKGEEKERKAELGMVEERKRRGDKERRNEKQRQKKRGRE